MTESLTLKVYQQTEYMAALKHAKDAAAMVALYGPGSTIRIGHHLVVWREGEENFSAAESYDRVASIVKSRLEGVSRTEKPDKPDKA
jgi:hypothetical protein